jgi:hypothetical protein
MLIHAILAHVMIFCHRKGIEGSCRWCDGGDGSDGLTLQIAELEGVVSRLENGGEGVDGKIRVGQVEILICPVKILR